MVCAFLLQAMGNAVQMWLHLVYIHALAQSPYCMDAATIAMDVPIMMHACRFYTYKWCICMDGAYHYGLCHFSWLFL